MDKNLLIDKDIKEGMVDACELLNINMQYATSGKETEGGVIAKKLGIKTGVVSVPVRYINTPSEMASISDTEDSIMLISKFLAGELQLAKF
jgi:endoglucanase